VNGIIASGSPASDVSTGPVEAHIYKTRDSIFCGRPFANGVPLHFDKTKSVETRES